MANIFMSSHESQGLRKPLPFVLWCFSKCASAGWGEGREGWEMETVVVDAIVASVDVNLRNAGFMIC